MTQSDSQEDDLEVSAQEFNKITSIHHKVSEKLEEIGKTNACRVSTLPTV